MAAWKHQYSENQLTLICTYNGTATTPFHPNTVWQASCTTEQQRYAPTHNCCKKKRNISFKHSRNVNTPHGPSTEQTWEARIQTEIEQEKSTTKLAKITTNKAYTWWCHIIKASVKGSRNHATNLGYRFTSKDDRPSEASLWLQRTKILLPPKVESYADINAMKMGVKKSILENLLDPLQRGSKNIRRPLPPIYDYCNITDHTLNINNFTIVGREDQNLTRAIKEALFIRVNDPSLNRNIGKYHLPHILDELLHKTSELKLKDWPGGPSTFHFGYNICQTTPMVGIPSATLAITSAKHELSSTVAVTPATWQQHLPNISIQLVAITSAMGHNNCTNATITISGTSPLGITPANTINIIIKLWQYHQSQEQWQKYLQTHINQLW